MLARPINNASWRRRGSKILLVCSFELPLCFLLLLLDKSEVDSACWRRRSWIIPRRLFKLPPPNLIFGHIYFKSTFAIFLNINKITYWIKLLPFKGRWIKGRRHLRRRGSVLRGIRELPPPAGTPSSKRESVFLFYSSSWRGGGFNCVSCWRRRSSVLRSLFAIRECFFRTPIPLLNLTCVRHSFYITKC